MYKRYTEMYKRYTEMYKRYTYDWNRIRGALEEETRKKRITEEMLAQEIGISQSLYSMFMRGKRKRVGLETIIIMRRGLPDLSGRGMRILS